MTNRRRPDWLVHQMPVGMLEDNFFVRFIRIFQAVAETVEVQADNLPHLFDVAVTPDVMVRAIGSWLGIDWVRAEFPDRLQRDIVRGYSAGLQWRGTRRGLVALLELICGKGVNVTDNGGVEELFWGVEENTTTFSPHVWLSLPSTGLAREEDLLRIIASELPAHVTYEVVIAGKVVHPLPARALVDAAVSR